MSSSARAVADRGNWLDGSILWGGGSVLPAAHVHVADGVLTLTRVRDVERKDAAFRMVFESDLINEPEVARRVLRASDKCAESVAAVVQEDTGLPHEQSKLIGVALVGMSQVVARYWIARGDDIPREEASRIVSTLGWRGLTGFPKQDESETPPA